MKRTARELADALGFTLEGDGSVELRGVASPERAGPHDLVYLESATHADRIAKSAAVCVVASMDATLLGKTLLKCTKPRAGFARAAVLLLEPEPIASGIHPTAVIAASAQIGRGVAVGPYAIIAEDAHLGEHTQIGAHCVIGPGSWIGDCCRLHPRVTLYGGARLGHRVEIHSGAVIGADGFGYA